MIVARRYQPPPPRTRSMHRRPAPRRAAEYPAALSQIAKALEPRLRAKFLAAVKEFGESLALEDLATTLGRSGIDTILRAIDWADLAVTLQEQLGPVMRDAFTRAAASTVFKLNADGVTTGFRFDLTNPRAVQWVREHAAELITQISGDARETIRGLIERAFTDGIAPRDLARMIRENIGLTDRFATAVYNYEQRLIADGTTPERIAKLTENYTSRLLRVRADNIARTEINRASNRGQQAVWEKAADLGLIDRNTVKRIWTAAEDERTCPECEDLDGQEVGLEENFQSDVGDGMDDLTPPAHDSCRCAIVLEV